MKDLAAGDEPHDAPAGGGVLPFPDIVEAARSVGVEWYVAEQDEPGDSLVDIGRAFNYLADLAR
jgi:sugar phosphate isomerase/epimerase